MKRILLASVASVFVIGSALAQQATPMPGMDMKGMDMKMMEAMPKFTGDADIDFMKQMRTHHEAAIDMAKVVLANGKDVDTKKLAQENHCRAGKRDRDDRRLVEEKRSIVDRSYRRILVTGASVRRRLWLEASLPRFHRRISHWR